MNDYFKIHNPLKNIYHIEDPVGVFATLAVGREKALLVDTGSGLGDLKATVSELTGKPLIVVNTHGHIDHFGGNYQFSEVFLNPTEQDDARRYTGELDIRKTVLSRFESEGGRMEAERRSRFLGYRLENLRELDPDTDIRLGGLTAKPILMASHSPGMTGFYLPEAGLLLGGDSVCRMACLYFEEASPLEDHIRMLQRVKGIGFRHLLTSHSADLMDRDDFAAMAECAESYDPGQTVRYTDPFFPEYGGRLFIYESRRKRQAIVVVKERKRNNAENH